MELVALEFHILPTKLDEFADSKTRAERDDEESVPLGFEVQRGREDIEDALALGDIRKAWPVGSRPGEQTRTQGFTFICAAGTVTKQYGQATRNSPLVKSTSAMPRWTSSTEASIKMYASAGTANLTVLTKTESLIGVCVLWLRTPAVTSRLASSAVNCGCYKGS
jgi:hypothetical protein